MRYRGTTSAETDAEDVEMTAYEEPGRFGERSYRQHRESTSEPVHASTDSQSITGRIKGLFAV